MYECWQSFQWENTGQDAALVNIDAQASSMSTATLAVYGSGFRVKSRSLGSMRNVCTPLDNALDDSLPKYQPVLCCQAIVLRDQHQAPPELQMSLDLEAQRGLID